jgi:dienelactone hydrolase
VLRGLAVAVACSGALLPASAAAGPAALSGAWVGTYDLRGRAQVSVTLGGGRALVALGVGHAGLQSVPVSVAGARIRFSLPGRPTVVLFDGRLRGKLVRGTVRQGSARGTFRLARGAAPGLLARGLYRDGAGRTLAVVDDPWLAPRLVDLGSGEVHGLYLSGGGFAIGSGFATRGSPVGNASFAATGGIVRGEPVTRVETRQLEVRFPSGDHVLAGTLTLPPGPGPHPAVAFVHGSGPTQRAYFVDVQALLVGSGVGVLAYDKRGVGQSGGSYTGDLATEQTIDGLARDAEAAARFLAAQPEVDRSRVGLAGHSQAGWILPRAGSREPAVRFLIALAGPTVTQGETDYWNLLTGSGQRVPERSDAELEAEVERQGPSGVDPIPAIRSLRIPALWVYGGVDRQIPTRLSLRRLEPLLREPGRDFSVVVLPNANHGLVETQRGLNAEMLASSTFAVGLFPRLREWLSAHGLTSSGSTR